MPSDTTAPAFTPHAIRYRVFHDGKMYYPGEELAFVLGQDEVYTDDCPPFWDGLRLLPDAVAMLSTGLHDAEGREVWEGSLVVSGEVGDGAWEPYVAARALPVEWRDGSFVVLERHPREPKNDTLTRLYLLSDYAGKVAVVGDVFTGVREPESAP